MALWHHARRMNRLSVLEFIRNQDAVWNLPHPLAEALARDFTDVDFVSPGSPAEADAALSEADIVLGWAVRRDNFARARRLRWIQVTAASVTSLMFPELVQSSVIVTNGRGIHAVSMAEHALGVILAFARKLHLARDAQQRREWLAQEMWSGPPPFLDLAGATLGLIGFGTIGRAIAERARLLGMRVLAVRRHPAADPAPADEQWGPDGLPELLERSDWVVIVAPLTPETRGFIGAPQISRMRPGAVLINLGRGALVDEDALAVALASGAIAGAGLDVFRNEPLPPSSPFWTMPQVILTPHVSGFGPRYWERALEIFRRNLRAFLEGRPLENVVDKSAGY